MPWMGTFARVEIGRLVQERDDARRALRLAVAVQAGSEYLPDDHDIDDLFDSGLARLERDITDEIVQRAHSVLTGLALFVGAEEMRAALVAALTDSEGE